MLDQLNRLLRGPLQEMLDDKDHVWKTVDVTYEDPRVHRVWTQWGENRVNLHRIYPCEKPLFHPHPWPSAMVVCGGTYTMGVGFSAAGEAPAEVAAFDLAPSSCYEMVHPHGWHWVKPLGGVVTSVMVTGKPWEMPDGFPRHGKGHVHKELSDRDRDDLLMWFRIWMETHTL